MAHRVAELISRADALPDGAEKETAEREAADLIIRLWEKRTHWLYASPLAGIADFLAQLVESDGHRRHSEQQSEPETDESKWTAILSRVIELNTREMKVCRYAALAEHNLDKEREWLENHRENLSEDEISITETLIAMRVASEGEYFNLGAERVPKFALLTPEERTAKVIEVLTQIAKERENLFRKIAAVESTEENKANEKEAES